MTGHDIEFKPKDIISKFDDENASLSYIMNLILLLGKFHIHKAKFSKSSPSFTIFLIELKSYVTTLSHVTNQKAERTIAAMCDIFSMTKEQIENVFDP